MINSIYLNHDTQYKLLRIDLLFDSTAFQRKKTIAGAPEKIKNIDIFLKNS